MPSPRPSTICVHVVEDNESLRNGMRWMLEASPGFACGGAHGSCEAAFCAWQDVPPSDGDVVLMDIGLPGISGIEGIGQIHLQWPAVQAIMLTVYEDAETILHAIQAGAVGYLVKSTPPPDLLRAIETVVAGGSSLSGPIAMRILETLQQRRAPQPQQAFGLTDRERDILHGLVDGLTYRAVGDRLGISIDTVRSHIKRLYGKMHVHSRGEAVSVAMREGVRPTASHGTSLRFSD